jgi:hypothetical protein
MKELCSVSFTDLPPTDLFEEFVVFLNRRYRKYANSIEIQPSNDQRSIVVWRRDKNDSKR